MKKIIIFGLILAFTSLVCNASPIKGLLERIDKGASSKFIIEEKKSDVDFFELDQKNDKVVMRISS